LELSGTFPISTVAGLNFELAIRGREVLCDESLVFTCHGKMDMSNESYFIHLFLKTHCVKDKRPHKMQNTKDPSPQIVSNSLPKTTTACYSPRYQEIVCSCPGNGQHST
jgi:hypothetical protein